VSGRVDLELAVRWRDVRASHRDRRVFRGVDAVAARVGEQALAALLAAGPAATQTLALSPRATTTASPVVTPRSDWPEFLSGQRIAPRPGRWFPRLVLAGRPGFVAGDATPLRVVAADAQSVTIDAAAPLAGIALSVETTLLSPATTDAGPAGDLLPLLLANGPGMQAALAEVGPEPPQDDDLVRAEDGADADFYAAPRFVDHLDAVALDQLRLMHGRFAAPGMRILDLMASCNSHLPEGLADIEVSGLGMNAAELARNPRLARRVVHDLNASPALPFATAEFDLALCALSVEYLVHPLEVFAEVARVLKPGACFVVTFSERWFPPKAIRLWGELHPFERIGLVLDYFQLSGRFVDLHSESLRGLARPVDDKYYRMTRLSDPIYAVWGRVPPTASGPSG